MEEGAIFSPHPRRDKAPSSLVQMPTPYTPHVYTLSVGGFVGRKAELQGLSDWANNSHKPVYTIVDLGGMGKSALAWEWFNNHTGDLDVPFDGAIWWSFYEENAGYAEFLSQALAYLLQKTPDQFSERSVDENCRALIAILNSQRILLCLDGLERIMGGYRSFDVSSSYSTVDTVISNIDAIDIDAFLIGHSSEEMKSQRYRRALDRADSFLRQICSVSKSCILVTSRLRPADFEDNHEQVRPGVELLEKLNLVDDDALQLFRLLEIKSSPRTIKSISKSVENHPLTLRVLAGEVKNNRHAETDLDKWIALQKDFHPANLNLRQVKSHILQAALKGLGVRELYILSAISAFRGPAKYDDIEKMVAGPDSILGNPDILEFVLRQLESRNLIGWSPISRAFDMHPIVRAIIWRNISVGSRVHVAQIHGDYFATVTVSNRNRSIDDYFSLQQRFFSLIELGRYDDGYELAKIQLHDDAVIGGRAYEISTMLESLLRRGNLENPLISHKYRIDFWINLGFIYSYAWKSDLSMKCDTLLVQKFDEASDDEKRRIFDNLIMNVPLRLLYTAKSDMALTVWEHLMSLSKGSNQLKSFGRTDFWQNELFGLLHCDEGDFASAINFYNNAKQLHKEDLPASWHGRFISMTIHLCVAIVQHDYSQQNFIPASALNYALSLTRKFNLDFGSLDVELAILYVKAKRDNTWSKILPRVQYILSKAQRKNAVTTELFCHGILLEISVFSKLRELGAQAALALEELENCTISRGDLCRAYLKASVFWLADGNNKKAMEAALKAIAYGSTSNGTVFKVLEVKKAKLILENVTPDHIIQFEIEDHMGLSEAQELVNNILALEA